MVRGTCVTLSLSREITQHFEKWSRNKLCVTNVNLTSKMAAVLCLVVLLITLNSALSARIAGFSGAASGSHYLVVKRTMEELSARGHEVG